VHDVKRPDIAGLMKKLAYKPTEANKRRPSSARATTHDELRLWAKRNIEDVLRNRQSYYKTFVSQHQSPTKEQA